MSASFELKGLDRLRSTIQRKLGDIPDQAGMALRTVGELWMTEAKKRTPVDFGTLKGSGHVVGPENVERGIQIRLVFGGPAAPYAAIVHENLSARHPVGQAKYLESVVLDRKAGLTRELARFMR